MKKKTWAAILIILLAAAVLAVTGELVLDRTVNRQQVEEIQEKAVYQLFPSDRTRYFDCEYQDGVLTPDGGDPQMIWTVSPDVSLADLTIRYSTPLETECEIQVYYDTAGEGFTAENVLSVIAYTGSCETVIPLARNQYYYLRVDINGTVPLESIDCDASGVILKSVPGAFQRKRCVMMFVLLAAILWLFYAYRNREGWRCTLDTCGHFLCSDLIWAFLVSVCISIFFSLYYHLREFRDVTDVIRQTLHPFFPLLVVSFLLIYGSIYVSRKKDFVLAEWLYKKRWLLGGCLLVICVLLNLNISSLHEWAAYLGSSDKNGVLLGVTRSIRSDEWVKSIGIVKALSYENWPAYSTLIRAASTENVMITGHIAWDISALFRPSSWGFLVFGSASYGLSFNNWAVIIGFFLVSFDFFMMVSKSRKLSFAFASMLLFSPFVQWWTCYELIISSFVLLLAARKYLTTDSLRTKILCAIAVAIFAGDFALVLYPAWQVPLAYFLLAGLIWTVVSNRKQIKLRLRVDLPVIGCTLLFLAVCGVLIYTRSAAALHDMMNTVYPGTVRASAPMSVSKLYLSNLNMFSPYTPQYVPGPNLSEAADFITFFPAGILLCVFAMIRNKKADLFSILMLVLSGFLAIFCFLDVP